MSSDKMLKDAIKAGKIVIGTKSVTKAMKKGGLVAVFTPSNCPAGTMKEAEYYTGMSKTEMHKFSGNSADLGQACGKPFKIAILGIEK